jgi:hypothetical protein
MINKIIEKISDGIKAKLWGKIIITFQDGKPVMIEINESTKL